MRLSPAKNPLYDGRSVILATEKNDPDAGLSRGICMYTHFDEVSKKNICFITLQSYQDPKDNFKWKGYDFPSKIFRPEDTLIKIEI